MEESPLAKLRKHAFKALRRKTSNVVFLLLKLNELLLELNTSKFMSVFYKKKIKNGLFVPKYEKSSVIPEDMCTKPCSGTIISWSTKCITGLILYPTIDT